MTDPEIRDAVMSGSQLLPGIGLPDIVLQAIRAARADERVECVKVVSGIRPWCHDVDGDGYAEVREPYDEFIDRLVVGIQSRAEPR